MHLDNVLAYFESLGIGFSIQVYSTLYRASRDFEFIFSPPIGCVFKLKKTEKSSIKNIFIR